MDRPEPLRFHDYLLIAIFSAVLFGYTGISGRPLTMHEARLPQTSREMLVNGDWLLPHSGIRPWLERPPLPHWVVVGFMKLFHRDDQVWVVRLPSVFMGLITVLLVAWMAGRWFGRTIALLSALILATSYEFFQYASLAEDDIYLAALVTICLAFFVSAESWSLTADDDGEIQLFENRRWNVWLFFIVLGLTNLTKGPLVGIIVVAPIVGLFLLWNALVERRWVRLRRYLWCWGWLVLIVLTVAWPLWAYHRYPDVVDNWKYDYFGRMSGSYIQINQRWYYYGPAWAAAMAPWTPVCLVGLAATARAVFRRTVLPTTIDSQSVSSAPFASSTPSLRFVWCWALAPLIVLSIPKGKHHHYLVPFVAPWAILAAFGAVEIGKVLLSRRGPGWLRNPLVGLCVLGLPAAIAIAWFHQRFPGPARLTLGLIVLWLAVIAALFIGLARASARIVLTSILCLFLVGFCWGETFVAPGTDHTTADTAFLLRVRGKVPAGMPLFINAKLGPQGNLDFFRMQFYTPRNATLLHNLSFLRDEKIKSNEVYVITRAGDEEKLKQLGTPTLIDQSESSHEITTRAGRFSLFKLTFDPGLKREPAPTEITNMQAMERKPGPWCGPAM